MQSPRRSLHLSLVVALAAAIAVPTLLASRAHGGTSSTASATGPQQEPGIDTSKEFAPRKAFAHTKHVPRNWTDVNVRERQRDCRGCHVYGRSETRDPQLVCTQCHFSDDKNQYGFILEADDENFLTGLQSLRSPGSLFQHNNHLALECRECHAGSASSIEAPVLMPKSGGVTFCQECHVNTKPRQQQLSFMLTHRDGTEITPEYKTTAMAKLPRSLVASLNGKPSMGPNRPGESNVGPFRHSDHIQASALSVSTPLERLRSGVTAADAAREGNCAACHGPLFEAAANPGEAGQHVPFEQAKESCGACHISDDDRSQLRFEVAHTSRPSLTLATFSHAAHLGFTRPAGRLVKSSAAGYAAIETEGCNACHEPNHGGPQDFALKGALGEEHSFQGCQTCHETSAWAPEEHGAWSTHEDHGFWQSCTACHDFARSSFAENRVVVQVERARTTRFRIDSQEHPHITVAGGESIEDSCAKCHRQPVQELPSRVREATFQHGTHLPRDAGPEACVDCHGSVVSSSETSATLGLHGATGPAVLYDASACTECHLGSAPVALATASVAGSVAGSAAGTGGGTGAGHAVRNVPEFSHSGHIGKLLTDGTAVGCTSCHDSAGISGGGGPAPPGVGTLASARDCSMCHSHATATPAGAGRAPSTGQGITAAEVAACTLCHVDGLPAADSEITWPSAQIVNLAVDDLSIGQFHPAGAGGVGECSNCHIDSERLVSSQAAPTGSRVFARRVFYMEPKTQTRTPAIHRNKARNTEGVANCFFCHWTDSLVGYGGWGTGTTNPEIEPNRRKIGDNLLNYPGGHDITSDR